jgi:hypothetical protein
MELGGIPEGMENLSAYTILHLLAENPTARGLNVQWAFNDVEDGGWARGRLFAWGGANCGMTDSRCYVRGNMAQNMPNVTETIPRADETRADRHGRGLQREIETCRPHPGGNILLLDRNQLEAGDSLRGVNSSRVRGVTFACAS